MTARQNVAQALDLPDTAEWDEIEDQILLIRKIEEGIQSSKEHGSIPIDEALERLQAHVDSKHVAKRTARHQGDH